MHGDLTGVSWFAQIRRHEKIFLTCNQSNILIDDNMEACLCDFGLSTTLTEFRGSQHHTSTVGGSLRWMDISFIPKYNDLEKGNIPICVTERSDIYSFGSIMLQVAMLLLLDHWHFSSPRRKGPDWSCTLLRYKDRD